MKMKEGSNWTKKENKIAEYLWIRKQTLEILSIDGLVRVDIQMRIPSMDIDTKLFETK